MKPGDRVVCVRSHSNGRVIKGDKCTVIDTFACSCGMRHVLVDAQRYWVNVTICNRCCKAVQSNGLITELFRKLDEDYKTNAVTKELAEEIQRELTEVDKEPDKVKIPK